MSAPYRSSEHRPPAPLEKLERRRRVLKSALWAELLVAGEIVLLLASHWLPARFALAGAVAWFVIGAALAVATWMYTAPRPRWQGWLLRASVPVYLGVSGLLLLGMHLEAAILVLGPLLMLVVFGYIWPFRRMRRRSRREVVRDTLIIAGVVTIAPYLDPIVPPWLGLELCLVFFLAVGPQALRRALRPVELRWWFDGDAKPPGEWAALLVYRDQLAEVLFVDDRPGWFKSNDNATAWLEDQGYVPAERATREGLVSQLPAAATASSAMQASRRRRRARDTA